MKYIADFQGRKAGAIGIFYRIRVTVEAESPEAARMKLYEEYEHLSGVQLTPVTDEGGK